MLWASAVLACPQHRVRRYTWRSGYLRTHVAIVVADKPTASAYSLLTGRLAHLSLQNQQLQMALRQQTGGVFRPY